MKGQLPENDVIGLDNINSCKSDTHSDVKADCCSQRDLIDDRTEGNTADIERELEIFADLLIEETTDSYYRKRNAGERNEETEGFSVRPDLTSKANKTSIATKKKCEKRVIEEYENFDRTVGSTAGIISNSCNANVLEGVSSELRIGRKDILIHNQNVRNDISSKIREQISYYNTAADNGALLSRQGRPLAHEKSLAFEGPGKNVANNESTHLDDCSKDTEMVSTQIPSFADSDYNYVLLDNGLLIPENKKSSDRVVLEESTDSRQEGQHEETVKTGRADADVPILKKEVEIENSMACGISKISKVNTARSETRTNVGGIHSDKIDFNTETLIQPLETSQVDVRTSLVDQIVFREGNSESKENEHDTCSNVERMDPSYTDIGSSEDHLTTLFDTIVRLPRETFTSFMFDIVKQERNLKTQFIYSANTCVPKCIVMPFYTDVFTPSFRGSIFSNCLSYRNQGRAPKKVELLQYNCANNIEFHENFQLCNFSQEKRTSAIWKVVELSSRVVSSKCNCCFRSDSREERRHGRGVSCCDNSNIFCRKSHVEGFSNFCDTMRNVSETSSNALEFKETCLTSPHTDSVQNVLTERESGDVSADSSVLDNLVSTMHKVSFKSNKADRQLKKPETSFNMKFLEFIGLTRSETNTSNMTDTRVKERKTYVDQDLDDDEIDGKRNYSIDEKLSSTKYNKSFVITNLKGEDFNLKYLQEHGLQMPIYFKEKTGLGLRVPSENFQVSDVKACVGSRRMLDVMDVTTQKGIEMTMKDWVKYYETTEKDKLLNVISLEFSHTKLENYVESPALVRDVDWVDIAWPQHLKDCQTEATNVIDKMKYPKVQKYCLMSVKGCYTDFHIDFGGTSVWYHILHGEKVFWLIPPTPKNFAIYENWVLSGKQGDVFLGDVIGDCQKMTLTSGSTFIIPSGWIHAVYTPKDSLVFGGNFLHSFNIDKQLEVAAIEEKTHVPGKFRYPFYAEIGWYVLEQYVHCITGQTYLEKPKLSDDLEFQMSGMSTSPESPLMDDIKVETPKPETEVTTPKLPKRVAVTLTRIDNAYSQSPRRHSSSDDDSMASGPPRSPLEASEGHRSYRKSSTDSSTSVPDSVTDSKQNKSVSSIHGDKTKGKDSSSRRKKMKNVLLTKYEKIGLTKLVQWIEDLPPSKKGVPKDLLDSEAVLREIKRILEEHMNDSEKMAATGEPILVWTKATKKLIKLKQKAKLLGATGVAKGTGKSSKGTGDRHRRVRCKKCEPCTRDDCRECNFCKDMKKYGGPGRMKQSCISRQCLAPCLANSATCRICKEDVHLRDASGEEMSTLMECGICWEIVHPNCLKTKENLEGEGTINEDLPNSWICIKCNTDGKEKYLKPRVFKGGWRPSPAASPSPVASPNPEIHPGDEHVTEGKRVVSKQSTDLPKVLLSKTNSEGSIHLSTPSSPWQHGHEKSVDVKPEITVVKEEENSEAEMEVEESKTPVKAVSHNSVKKSVKRKSPGTADEPDTGQKKPRISVSVSPKGKGKSPKPQKPIPASRSASGKKLKKSPQGGRNPLSPELGTGVRPKREENISGEYHDPSASYDFDDSEVADTQTIILPHLEKGKGAIAKGGRRQKSGKLFRAQLPEVHNPVGGPPVGTGAASLKLDITGSPVKQFCMKKKPDEIGKSLLEHIEKRGLKIVPQKYVVRPAPVSPPKNYAEMTSGSKHPLPHTIWTKIFNYLSSADLARCLCVCRIWNRWCINPELWKEIDLSRKKIVQNHLMGIVRRQPESLILSSVIMTPKQLTWLVERIPLLKKLVLSKCSWATMSGLCTSACPLLTELDISWAMGITDQFFEDLITPPVDRKPAVKNISRLHRLKILRVGGTEITDYSVELMTVHLSRLEVLDLSYCTKITDKSIQSLTNLKSATQETLKVLTLSGCRQLTDTSLTMIKNFKHLSHLNLSACSRISADSLRHFRMHGKGQFVY